MSEAQMRRISYLRSIVKDRDAEIERLTAERDRQYDQNAEQITRIAALEAENERLRAALWDIHAICNNGPFVWAKRIRAIARAALEEKQ